MHKKIDSNNQINPENRFILTNELVQDLLDALLDYKTRMEYNNSDFNADISKQYEAVGMKMALKYSDQPSLFGPVIIRDQIVDLEDRKTYLKNVEDDKAKVRKGYSRFLEKIKTLRQKFSNAVTSGRRSGC